MSIEEIRKRLEYMNLAKVSREIGVSREILSRFMRGDSELSARVYLMLVKFFRTLEGAKNETIG